jgi:hypothetical protein
MNPSHVEWCRRLFASLKEGGVWGLPASGLIFMKRGKDLVLTARMPHTAKMPLTAEELQQQQDDLLELTRQHFGAAGVTVREESHD